MLFSWIASAYLRFVYLTSRTVLRNVGDAPSLQLLREGRAGIFTFWQDRMLLVIQTLSASPLGLLVNTTHRKDWLGAVCKSFGPDVFEISLGNGGRHSLISLMERLKAGRPVALSADGNTGTREEPKAGPFILAQETGAPLIPINAKARWTIKLTRGDEVLLLPLPFNRIEVTFGPPLPLSRHMELSDLKEGKKLLKQGMDKLTS